MCYTLRQDLEANSPYYLAFTFVVTHTGQDYDMRRKLGPLDQQATFADVHLISRDHTRSFFRDIRNSVDNSLII